MDEEEQKVYDVYLDDADVDEASEEDDSITEVAQIEILPIEDLQKSKDEDSMDESEFIQRELSQRLGMTENAPPTRAQMAKRNRSKKKRGLLDALKFVANSPELSCLAVMAISQGIFDFVPSRMENAVKDITPTQRRTRSLWVTCKCILGL